MEKGIDELAKTREEVDSIFLKDKSATYSWSEENFYLQAIRKIKETLPDACLMSDVAMDPYSSDGHDGLVEGLSSAISRIEKEVLVLQVLVLQVLFHL